MQERHEHDLRVALATVTRLRVSGLERVPDLGDEHHGHTLLLRPLDRGIVVLVEARVDLRHVVALMAVRDGDVRVRLDLVRGDYEVSHHRQTDLGGRRRVAGTLDHTVSDDQDELVAVRVVSGSEGIQRRAKTLDRLGVSRDETDGVAQRESIRFEVWRWLRDDVVERERAWVISKSLRISGERGRAARLTVARGIRR